MFGKKDLHLVGMGKDGIIAVFNTPAPGGTMRVLYSGGAYQSATWLDERRFEPAFEYYRAFDRVFEVRPDAQRLLLLGGGGFAYPKYFLTTHDSGFLDVVEIDERITQAARTYFFLQEAIDRFDVGQPKRLRVLTADGRAILDADVADSVDAASIAATDTAEVAATSTNAGSGELRVGCYDAIINDTFTGKGPVRCLLTLEAMQGAKKHLSPDGVYLSNVVSQQHGLDLTTLKDVVATLAAVFENVVILLATDEEMGWEDNYLVLASDGPLEFPDALPWEEESDFLGTVLRD